MFMDDVSVSMLDNWFNNTTDGFQCRSYQPMEILFPVRWLLPSHHQRIGLFEHVFISGEVWSSPPQLSLHKEHEYGTVAWVFVCTAKNEKASYSRYAILSILIKGEILYAKRQMGLFETHQSILQCSASPRNHTRISWGRKLFH